MPFEDAADYRFNPFDLTKVWPHADYPPIDDRQVRPEPQPGELLRRGGAGRVRARQPGARASGRPRQDALGPAVQLSRHPPLPDRRQLPAAADQRAEVARSTATTRTAPCATATPPTRSTRPNTLGGPGPTRRRGCRTSMVEGGEIMRAAYTLHREDDDFVQPGALVREVLSETDRAHLVDNVVGHATAPEVTRGDASSASSNTGPTSMPTSVPASPGSRRRRRCLGVGQRLQLRRGRGRSPSRPRRRASRSPSRGRLRGRGRWRSRPRDNSSGRDPPMLRPDWVAATADGICSRFERELTALVAVSSPSGDIAGPRSCARWLPRCCRRLRGSSAHPARRCAAPPTSWRRSRGREMAACSCSAISTP